MIVEEYAPDVVVTRHGFNLLLFQPKTDAVREWLKENIDTEATWWCGSLVVEPRFAWDLVIALTSEGFDVAT